MSVEKNEQEKEKKKANIYFLDNKIVKNKMPSKKKIIIKFHKKINNS